MRKLCDILLFPIFYDFGKHLNDSSHHYEEAIINQVQQKGLQEMQPLIIYRMSIKSLGVLDDNLLALSSASHSLI